MSLVSRTPAYTEDVTAVAADAARDAERLLLTVWCSPDKIPVDPVLIARGLGIEVVNAELAANVSGALVKRTGQDPIVLVNSKDSANRRRFTCAHELGHFVRRSDQLDEYQYTDLRSDLAATGQDPEEIYANAFGACLLMPERMVRRLRGLGLNDWELALRFGVSREAMQHRLGNLRLA